MPLNERGFEIHLKVYRDISYRLHVLDLIRQVVVLVDTTQISEVFLNGYVKKHVTDLGFIVHFGGVLFYQVLVLIFKLRHIWQVKDEVKDVVSVIILTLPTFFEKIHVSLINEFVDILVNIGTVLFGVIRYVFCMHCFESLI